MSAPSETIIELYERNAAAWDQDRRAGRPAGEARWIKRFIDELQAGTAAVLDLGCGSGAPIASDLIDAGCAVTGVDSAPSLIAICRQRFPRHEWIAADMRKLDLGRRFGGIVAWHSLFHLSPEDQERMLPILARHAAPGAPLMFTSGSERGVRMGSWQGEPLYHASLDADEYQALLARNGFELISHVSDDGNCGGATIWLARRRPQ